jgi:hypothetical protein
MNHAAILARLLASGVLTRHSQSQVTEALRLCTTGARRLSVGESAQQR